jgi:hypothetical protein
VLALAVMAGGVLLLGHRAQQIGEQLQAVDEVPEQWD